MVAEGIKRNGWLGKIIKKQYQLNTWLRNKRKKSKNDFVSGLDNWVTVVTSTEF